MTIREFEATPEDELPAWVEVSGGHLMWEKAIVVFDKDESDSTEKYDKVVVPFLSSEAMNHSGSSETLCVLSIPWKQFEKDFPTAMSEALISGSDLSQEDLIQIDSLSFVTDNPFISSPVEATSKKEWKKAWGFNDVVTVGWKSEPPTAGENLMGTLMGGLMMAGGLFLLVRRSDKKNGRGSAMIRPSGTAVPGVASIPPSLPASPSIQPAAHLLQTQQAQQAVQMLRAGRSDGEVMQFLKNEWIGRNGEDAMSAQTTASSIIQRFRERFS